MFLTDKDFGRIGGVIVLFYIIFACKMLCAQELGENKATVIKAWPKDSSHVVTVGIKYGAAQTYQGVTLIVHDHKRGMIVLWSEKGKIDEIPEGNYTGIIQKMLWVGVK